jgi:hypothetical protein
MILNDLFKKKWKIIIFLKIFIYRWACWEDVSESFDISRHVRLLNGLGGIVTEDKVLDILGKLQDTRVTKSL